MPKKISKLLRDLDHRVLTSSGRVIPRINFKDVSVFTELQEEASRLQPIHDALAKEKYDFDADLQPDEVTGQASRLSRVEQHVKAAGPIVYSQGTFLSWNSKDLASWILLHDELGCICHELVILWVMGRIDLHCPKLAKVAA